MKIRPAEHEDVQTMVRIISHYASEGLMLPRSHGALAEALPNYLVADIDGDLIGLRRPRAILQTTAPKSMASRPLPKLPIREQEAPSFKRSFKRRAQREFPRFSP